ncbi:cobalt-precorrin-5B (C(1))-methyltransferase CbiD [Cellulosilyticum sp. I15G10I2]|uniref:cobalt-precorrin-5B (C(1))-methyltransferase CbiD n=1 Tax=Cellulosilyticum sp. I15G10I2 TaxID=1892843 RepID=UPI002E8E2F40|nr:cobalt-precorrin-5B (C(1))-methyltransferase CbiD [Cellulosilyticum sp. I15G10I2]
MTMEEFVYISGKKYRRGYTTGSCAAGAARAAAKILITQNKVETIEIDTPKGITLKLKVENVTIGEDYVTCAIQKDGGDDIDATHQAYIYATVKLNQLGELRIFGGTGVGVVTQKGLGLEVGGPAINKTPRDMILKEVAKILGDQQGADITIEVPDGEEIAKKTFNPRLGIVGGISIIGTTGIVEPMSDDGWKKSLSLELEMKKQQGINKVILVSGNHGERFAKEVLGLSPRYIVRTSNFIGYMLDEAKRIGYKDILLIGHLGKYVKLAAGIFNTHSHIADARSEILVANLALMGAPLEVLQKVSICLTTEEAMDIIDTNGYEDLYTIIATKCKKRVDLHLREEQIQTEVILFSLDGKLLGQSEQADKLKEVLR